MNQDKMGPFIAKLRKEKHLTQKELAELLNITQAAVSKWEKGISFPDLFLIEDLSDILGVKISELLNGERLEEVSTKQKENSNRLKIVIVLLVFILICIIIGILIF